MNKTINLESLSQSDIEAGSLPLNLLLQDSLYYPSAGLDGAIVKHFSNQYQSFVMCDYAQGFDAFSKEVNHFKGYQIVGQRALVEKELIPNGWDMQIPPGVHLEEYLQYQSSFKTPFAHWAVYERLPEYDESHGVKRFSLLYIGGEGVATYQALYWSNKQTAKALAIVQPGTGFGLNYTDFRDSNKPLGWVVLQNTSGTPDTIIYGGIGNEYSDLNWQDYKITETIISPYYNIPDHPKGKATIWKRIK